MRSLFCVLMLSTTLSAAVLADAASSVRMAFLPAPSKGESWQPGIHYGIYLPPHIAAAAPGKVQLRMPFLYTYGRHADNEQFQGWLKTKPDYIEVLMAPNIRWPHAREQARLYFTLQKMGREDLHLSLYDWINDQTESKPKGTRYPVYHNLFYPDLDAIFHLNLEFAKKNGLDKEKFTEIYYSKAMKDRIARAEAEAQSNGFQEVVVNGRYYTHPMRLAYLAKHPAQLETNDIYSNENMTRFFRLIEYLAASEYEHIKKSAPQ